jgi:hypothetical protein
VVKAEIAIVESAFTQVFVDVRAAFSALREAEAQAQKSEERSVKAQRIASTDREFVDARRVELGKLLLKARTAWPERGPKAKGWGEFLAGEGIEQSTAWRWMELAGGKQPGGGDFMHDDRVHEIPHAADRADASLAEPPTMPRKVFGKMADLPLYVGRWQDVLVPDVGQVDVLITDPPFSKKTHDSAPTRNDDVDPAGLAPTYAHWEPEDVIAFVEYWSTRTRGWMNCLCDDVLIPIYRAAYERMGRVAFAPVPCVINGMTVRTRADGPSSWAVYAMVARPQGGEFARWGTLPGAYVGPRVDGAKSGRGKPPWLTDALVKDYSRGNDLICDPLAGYGGTLISAIGLGRRAVGAEMDPDAVEEAFKRASKAAGETTPTTED